MRSAKERSSSATRTPAAKQPKAPVAAPAPPQRVASRSPNPYANVKSKVDTGRKKSAAESAAAAGPVSQMSREEFFDGDVKGAEKVIESRQTLTRQQKAPTEGMSWQSYVAEGLPKPLDMRKYPDNEADKSAPTATEEPKAAEQQQAKAAEAPAAKSGGWISSIVNLMSPRKPEPQKATESKQQVADVTTTMVTDTRKGAQDAPVSPITPQPQDERWSATGFTSIFASPVAPPPSPSSHKAEGDAAPGNPSLIQRIVRSLSRHSDVVVNDDELPDPKERGTPSPDKAKQEAPPQVEPTATEKAVEETPTKQLIDKPAEKLPEETSTPQKEPSAPAVEKATPRGRSATPKKVAASPVKAASPKRSMTPVKKAATPRRSATPKKVVASPVKAASPKRSVTPVKKAATPRRSATPVKAVSPKRSVTPAKKAATPRRSATPVKAVSPKRSMTPAKKAATPRRSATPKKVAASPVKAASPKRSVTPVKKAATPRRSATPVKAVSPKRSMTPAKKAATPRRSATPKKVAASPVKAASPKRSMTPVKKAATPRRSATPSKAATPAKAVSPTVESTKKATAKKASKGTKRSRAPESEVVAEAAEKELATPRRSATPSKAATPAKAVSPTVESTKKAKKVSKGTKRAAESEVVAAEAVKGASMTSSQLATRDALVSGDTKLTVATLRDFLSFFGEVKATKKADLLELAISKVKGEAGSSATAVSAKRGRSSSPSTNEVKEAKPNATWTVAELREYARKMEVDLPKNAKKADILKAVSRS